MLFRVCVAFVALLSSGLSFTFSQEQAGEAAPAPIVLAGNALKDPSSYALGFNVGSDLARTKLSEKEMDVKEFMIGFLDALNEREPKLDDNQMQAAFMALQQRMQKKMLEIGKSNMEKSMAYLEANKKKDGVQLIKSGIQYQVLKTGNGKQPTLTDSVIVHYEGKLVDGTIFDSSIKRNEPASFKVNQVVPGWTEVLQRMKVGDKWLVTIPPSLGYGERGGPNGMIGPNEALIFEMELLDVKK